MTLRRLPDEDPQNLADPAYRRRRIIMQNMRDEELAIAQVEEMQAVSAVLKGKYTMTGEAFDPVEVDMGRSAANNITQSGGTEWSKRDKSTYDPTDDIEAYALNASGVVNIIVFDPKGWALFRSFKAVKEKLDPRTWGLPEQQQAHRFYKQRDNRHFHAAKTVRHPAKHDAHHDKCAAKRGKSKARHRPSFAGKVERNESPDNRKTNAL